MQKQKQTSLFGKEEYAPTISQKILWWLATAEKEIIQHCVVDRNRYAIIGITVLGTWIFATLAWAYFFSTVVSEVFFAIVLGIFMGGIILSIDRALIKGINKHNKNKFFHLVFRGLLAITIGTFMAQPVLLYLFDKEIHTQISLDNVEKIKLKQQRIDSLYIEQKTELEQRKNSISSTLARQHQQVTTLRNAFISETDGTGGTGKIGFANVARTKQVEYLKLDAAYQQLTKTYQPELTRIDSALQSIETGKYQEMQDFKSLLNDGFLTRIEALNNLVQTNGALQFRYYLLIVILMLIELMPVIAKTLLPDGSYSYKVTLREVLEREIADQHHQIEKDLLKHYNQYSFHHNQQRIQDLFQENNAKDANTQQHAHNNKQDASFNDIWNYYKKNKLAKLEQ